MMRHVSCILLLEWSTNSQRPWVYRISVPYAQKISQIPVRKEKGATPQILVSHLNNRLCGRSAMRNTKKLVKHTKKKRSNLTVFGSFHIDLLDFAVCTHVQIDDILCLTSYLDSGEGASCWK